MSLHNPISPGCSDSQKTQRLVLVEREISLGKRDRAAVKTLSRNDVPLTEKMRWKQGKGREDEVFRRYSSRNSPIQLTKFAHEIRAGRFWWRGKPVCENGTGPRLKPRGRNAVSHISPRRSDGRWFWWRGKPVCENGTGPRLKPRGRNAVSHISGRSDSRLLMVESYISPQDRQPLRTDCPWSSG